MLHHNGEIEVFDAGTGAHLGTAILADSAPPQTRARVLQTRAGKARALRSDLAAAERERRVRYAASTVPEPVQRLDVLTTAEAAAVLAAERDGSVATRSGTCSCCAPTGCRRPSTLVCSGSATGVHLVLVWHSRDPLSPRLAMPAGVRPHITDDLVALTGRLPPPRRDIPAPTDASELPAVPDGDCVTFLPAAAAALSGADYDRVAAVYHQAVETTSRRLTACGRAPDLARRMLGYLPAPRSHLRPLYGTIPPGRILHWHAAVGLGRLLGDLVVDSPGRGHTLTRLRGAQAAFERHGLPLVLPPNLNHMVGVGLTTTPITEQVITRIRARVANPAHAAALATLLFTGTTYRELNFLPWRALTGDTVVFPGTRRVDHPADLRVWVIPPPARPLLHAAALFQETRTVPTARLFADAIGPVGRTEPDRPGLQGTPSRSAPLAGGMDTPHRRPQPQPQPALSRVLSPDAPSDQPPCRHHPG